MTLWRSVFLLAVLGVFTIVFLSGITLIGLKTDRTGGGLPEMETAEPTDGETEGEAEETALWIDVAISPGLPV